MKLNKGLKIIIACGGFLFVCFFISFKAHAEETGNLPYNVSLMSSYNQIMLDNSRCQSAIDYALNNNFITTEDSILIFTTEGLYNRERLFQYTFIVNPYCEQIVQDDFDYLTNSITFKSDSEIFNVLVHITSGASGSNTQHLTQASLLGNSSSVSTSLGSYLPRYPFYYNGEPILSANGKVVLIANAIGPEPIEGHATAPTFGGGSGVNGSDFLGTGADFGASLSQATMPQAPTYNNFNFGVFSPPSFDDSSILDALDSIAQILLYTGNYIVSNVLGAFSTLMSNIIKIGEYIVGVFEYIGRSIITNIQNAIQNLYENFKSLVEPIFQLLEIVKEKVDYITEEFSQEEWEENYSNCEFISAYDNIQNNCEEIRDILTYAEEREYYHLYLTFPKPDGTNVESMISFDWLYPLRSSYRPFLWVIVLVELFVTACSLLGSILGGKAK